MSLEARSSGEEPRGRQQDELPALLGRLNAAVGPDDMGSALAESSLSLSGGAATLLYLISVSEPELIASSPGGAIELERLRTAPAPDIVVRAAGDRSVQRGALPEGLIPPGGYGVAVPLADRDGVIGVIVLVYAEESAAGERPADALTPGWRQAGAVGLRRGLEHRNALDARGRLRRLHDVGYAVASSLDDSEQILRLVARKAREILDADGALVGLVRGDGLEYIIEDRRPGLGQNVVGQRVSLDASIGGWVVQHGKPVVCEDLLNDPRLPAHILPLLTVESALLVPLRTHERIIGVLAVEHERRRNYPEDYTHILEILANQMAAALESADLFDRIRRSEERYRELLRVAPVPIVSMDLQGRITHANEAAATVAGVALDELIGHSFLAFIPSEDRESALERRAQVLAGATLRFETELLLPGNVRRTFAIVSSPLVEGGAVIGNMVIMRDVTDEKQIQARLIQSEKLTAMGELVSGVAHELNNPLAGIVNLVELVSLEATDPQTGEWAAGIKAEAQRAARIVRSLQLFARTQPSRPSRISLPDLLDRALALWRSGSGAAGFDVVKSYDEVPEIRADPVQLQQAFLNLIRNAEHAMRSTGGGTLTVAVSTANETIRITISDTGPGVPSELRARIFDPFFTTKSTAHATGLGLSIAYRIVSELGGAIRYEDAPGGGAAFVIELPAKGWAGGAAPFAPGRGEGEGGPPIRVLIVDDEASVRRSVARLLARKGYETDVAADGRSALEKLGGLSFDVILTDVNMPEMDGPAFFAELRARDRDLLDRVVFTTGDTVNVRTARFLESCGRPSIPKPFDIEELEVLLRSVARAASPGE